MFHAIEIRFKVTGVVRQGNQALALSTIPCAPLYLEKMEED